MKKLLLICLTFTAILLQGCDERITPSDTANNGGGTTTGGTTTGGTTGTTTGGTTGTTTGTTAQKTASISRKWAYKEVYVIVDGKKSVIYGSNQVTLPPTFSFDVTPNDYKWFIKDGNYEEYDDIDKTTTKGTWKFLNSDKQLNISNDKENTDYTIDDITDKTLGYFVSVTTVELATASQGQKSAYLIAALAGLATKDSKSVTLGVKFTAK
ncbi:MAG: hypothetical protein RLZZ306_750 [Bacteroidota bacterium]|jgi:hypothetical protein